MSLVQETLAVHTSVTIETSKTDLEDALKQLETLKEIFVEYFQDTEIKLLFRAEPIKIQQIKSEAVKYISTLSVIDNNLKDIIKIKSKDERNAFQQLLKDKKKADEIAESIKYISDKSLQINALKNLIVLGEHMKAAELLQDLKSFDFAYYPLICKEIRKKIFIYSAKLFCILDDNLKKQIQMQASMENDFEVKALLITANKKKIAENLKARLLLKNSIQYLENVAGFLMDQVFSNIVKFSTDVTVQQTTGYFIQLKIKVDKKCKDEMGTVFKNIAKVAEFLKDNYDVSVVNNESTLLWLRKTVEKNLIELICNYLEDSTLPEDSLEQFTEIKNLVNNLQTELILCELLAPNSPQLYDYVNDALSLFLGNQYKKFAKKALELTKKDLQHTVILGEQSSKGPKEESTMQFTLCAVSKSTPKLFELIEDILIAAAKITEEKHAMECVSLAFKIVSAYAETSHKHHQQFIKSNPQLLAIFYNNCNYFSHQLRSAECFKNLPTFDLVPGRFVSHASDPKIYAKKLLEEYLDQQMRSFKTAITKKRTVQAVDEAHETFEKGIVYCLQQLQRLQIAWQHVLDANLYALALGDLLNSVASYSLEEVFALAKISKESAEFFVRVLQMVLQQGEMLFPDGELVFQVAKDWRRLQEVIFVLAAEDVLSVGQRLEAKGFLGQIFAPAKLKKLITLVFEDTESRKELLSKIN